MASRHNSTRWSNSKKNVAALLIDEWNKSPILKTTILPNNTRSVIPNITILNNSKCKISVEKQLTNSSGSNNQIYNQYFNRHKRTARKEKKKWEYINLKRRKRSRKERSKALKMILKTISQITRGFDQGFLHMSLRKDTEKTKTKRRSKEYAS